MDDPVYNIIEYALLRNYCENLPNARPYTLNTVLEVLRQIQSSPDASVREKILARETLERLQPKHSSDNAKGLLKNGSYTWEQNGTVPIRVSTGASAETSLYTNFNAPNISALQWFDAYIKGDISRYFSYNVNLGMSIMKLDVADCLLYTSPSPRDCS